MMTLMWPCTSTCCYHPGHQHHCDHGHQYYVIIHTFIKLHVSVIILYHLSYVHNHIICIYTYCICHHMYVITYHTYFHHIVCTLPNTYTCYHTHCHHTVCIITHCLTEHQPESTVTSTYRHGRISYHPGSTVTSPSPRVFSVTLTSSSLISVSVNFNGSAT